MSGALKSPPIAPGAHRGWTRWAAPALVVVLTITAFLPAIHNEFLNWDDAQNYLDNPHYRGLGPRQLAWMFTTFHMGHYIPLTWITFGLDYLLWGVSPAGYHLTNILFHAATALAFYFVSLRLLRTALPESLETDLRVGAALAALLFAIHPLRAESVAWVTERRDVVSGLFYVLSVTAYLKAVDGVDRVRPQWYWTSIGLFACGLLSKSIVVSLPVVLLALDVYPLKRLGGDEVRRHRVPGHRAVHDRQHTLARCDGPALPHGAVHLRARVLSLEERYALRALAALPAGLHRDVATFWRRRRDAGNRPPHATALAGLHCGDACVHRHVASGARCLPERSAGCG